jgi:HAE1 family hydrophobic/amphiphilic exporter-1
MTGIMFRQLAVVVVFSLLCSLATALTLVPMLSSKLLSLSSDEAEDKGRHVFKIYHGIGSVLKGIEKRYNAILHTALNNRGRTVLIAVGILILAIVLMKFIDSELMPVADEGEIRVSLDMEAGTKLDVVVVKTRLVEGGISKTFLRQNIIANVGGAVGEPALRIPLPCASAFSRKASVNVAMRR